MNRLWFCFSIQILTACGSKPSEVSIGPKADTPPESAENPTVSKDAPDFKPALTVFALADLPRCDSSNQGKLVYVRSVDTFRTCVDSEWTKIDVRGKTGLNGERGEKGERGDFGP